MTSHVCWGVVSPSTETTPGGRVMPDILTSPAEAAFWLRIGYLVTEYQNGRPVRVYSLGALGK